MKKHTTLKAKFNSAFSLVELLVVIAVIAVIAAIAIPNITGAREAAVAAQEGYNADAVQRFVDQCNAVGATNSAGEAPTTTSFTSGPYTATVGTNTVSFTFTE